MFKKFLIKLIMTRKEQLMALFLEMLIKAYNESRADVAQKIVEALPEDMKKTAHPSEMADFMDVLKECLEKLYEAGKPLFKE